MKLPSKMEQALKSKKPAKFVLLRLPNDLSLSKDLDGTEIDLADLKLSSSQSVSAIPDLQINPERASACSLVPDEKGGLKCGPAFSAHIQIIKGNATQKSTPKDASSPVKIKKELGTKPSKKRKSEKQSL